MIFSLDDKAVLDAISGAQAAARARSTRTVTLNGQTINIPSPYPSPTDWRDTWIYFLLLDRFNAANPPRHPWDRYCGLRQGGTFQGVQAQLGYLQTLGVKAIWLSPIQKNAPPDWNYHGYGAQNFSTPSTPASPPTARSPPPSANSPRWSMRPTPAASTSSSTSSSTTPPTSSITSGNPASSRTSPIPPLWTDPSAASPPSAGWMRRRPARQLAGPPRSRRLELAPDDAVWPADLQNHLFFRRRGAKLTDTPDRPARLRAG